MAVGVQNVFYLGKWQLIFHSHGGWALIDRVPITPYLSQPHSFSSIPLSLPLEPFHCLLLAQLKACGGLRRN